MGSLGSARLHARSDLDVIVIYDSDGVEESSGRKQLPSRAYYARLTQALVTAVTAPMAEGRLYELDMRLRPSGNQGPVATSLASFREYQTEKAWLWEHLALTRARVVAGPADLAADVEAVRQEILTQSRDIPPVLKEVADMRARIASAKGPGAPWDPKLGQGRLQDIELIAQAGSLIAADPKRNVAEALAVAASCGWMPEDICQTLTKTYHLCWTLQTGARLISADVVSPETLGEGGEQFLGRLTGCDGLDGLEATLKTCSAEATEQINRLLSKGMTDEG
jgi:glutamate-ammonia-ligase adenylyltransferase